MLIVGSWFVIVQTTTGRFAARTSTCMVRPVRQRRAARSVEAAIPVLFYSMRAY
jgi:hypothetical protein